MLSFFGAGAQTVPSSISQQLLSKLNKCKPDTNRARILLKLGDYYLSKPGADQKNRDSALNFIKQEIQLTTSLKAFNLKHEGMLMAGKSFISADDINRGRPYFMQVITYYQQVHDKQQEAETWIKFGQCINRTNQPQLNLHTNCYRQAEKIYRETHQYLKAAKALKEIGDDHIVGGKLADAERELLQVVKEFKALHYGQLHYTYDLLASLARLQGDLKKQLQYSIEVVKSMEAASDTANATEFYDGLAATYRNLGMHEKAIIYYTEALRYRQSANYQYQYYFTVFNLAGSMVALHKPKEALALLDEVQRKSPPELSDDKIFFDEAYGACYTELHQIGAAKKYYADMVKLSDYAFKANTIGPLDYFVHTMI
jgi:tetratricopeptide (TPR) repeat protein